MLRVYVCCGYINLNRELSSSRTCKTFKKYHILQTATCSSFKGKYFAINIGGTCSMNPPPPISSFFRGDTAAEAGVKRDEFDRRYRQGVAEGVSIGGWGVRRIKSAFFVFFCAYLWRDGVLGGAGKMIFFVKFLSHLKCRRIALIPTPRSDL